MRLLLSCFLASLLLAPAALAEEISPEELALVKQAEEARITAIDTDAAMSTTAWRGGDGPVNYLANFGYIVGWPVNPQRLFDDGFPPCAGSPLVGAQPRNGKQESNQRERMSNETMA